MAPAAAITHAIPAAAAKPALSLAPPVVDTSRYDGIFASGQRERRRLAPATGCTYNVQKKATVCTGARAEARSAQLDDLKGGKSPPSQKGGLSAAKAAVAADEKAQLHHHPAAASSPQRGTGAKEKVPMLPPPAGSLQDHFRKLPCGRREPMRIAVGARLADMPNVCQHIFYNR
jgi:hypothetical protein